ncbi:hypothetical protein D5086_020437 [Populus alba]|uniref:Uncharacterized protein n=1 Tax=Populus alba TaxID=43335 RepID=A0ACC4BJZ6_POPAL
MHCFAVCGAISVCSLIIPRLDTQPTAENGSQCHDCREEMTEIQILSGEAAKKLWHEVVNGANMKWTGPRLIPVLSVNPATKTVHSSCLVTTYMLYASISSSSSSSGFRFGPGTESLRIFFPLLMALSEKNPMVVAHILIWMVLVLLSSIISPLSPCPAVAAKSRVGVIAASAAGGITFTSIIVGVFLFYLSRGAAKRRAEDPEGNRWAKSIKGTKGIKASYLTNHAQWIYCVFFLA